MKRFFGVISILVLVALFLPANHVVAQDSAPAQPPETAPAETAPSEAAPTGSAPSVTVPAVTGFPGCDEIIPLDATFTDIALLCNPAGKTDWILFAHGFVPIVPGMTERDNLDLAFQQLILPDGTTTLPALVNSLGYGFAASTYDTAGLAVSNGVQSMLNLAAYLKQYRGAQRIYLVGASEGGLVSTLIAEQPGTLFNGVVATCGPIGDFRKHVNYLGDFRVLFDYFFPNVFVLPDGTRISPIDIPDPVIAGWLGIPGFPDYKPLVLAAMAGSPSNSLQLMRTSKAAFDPRDPNTMAVTALKVLNYDIVETNNAKTVLGVQPFNNQYTWYFGSANDWLLNRRVERVVSDESAIRAALVPYQTTGKLKRTLVTLQTLLDPEVPAWHQTLYRLKVYNQHTTSLYAGIPILRYGHCNFKPAELVFGFYLMVYMSTGHAMSMYQVQSALPDQASFEAFQTLKDSYGSGTLETAPELPADQ